MGDVDSGDVEAGEDFLQQAAHIFAGGLIERGQWLVEQQQGGLDRQGAGQGYPLAFAAAERARQPAGQVPDSQPVQQRVSGDGELLAAGPRGPTERCP